MERSSSEQGIKSGPKVIVSLSNTLSFFPISRKSCSSSITLALSYPRTNTSTIMSEQHDHRVIGGYKA